jgi:hypothetical protein
MDLIFENLTNTTAWASTTAAPDTSISAPFGYLGLFLAVFFFGSNFLPVKKYETGEFAVVHLLDVRLLVCLSRRWHVLPALFDPWNLDCWGGRANRTGLSDVLRPADARRIILGNLA